MRFMPALVPGRLVRRYKRFFADVVLDSGEAITALCPNTGSMLGCMDAGSRVWVNHTPGPTRKLHYTWQLVEVAGGALAGINTHLPNRLVRDALDAQSIPELCGYAEILSEVRYGSRGSRVDFRLEAPGRPPCFLEVKNVTAAAQDGVAVFPDAVSTRAAKHLEELIDMAREGARAVLLYCVQRTDVCEVRPADGIDPTYGRGLRAAMALGVEVLAYRADLDPEAIVLRHRIEVHCPAL